MWNALTLPADAKLAFLTQTTLSVDEAKVVIDACGRSTRRSSGRTRTTSATRRKTARRPSATLVPEADVVLVLGSQNSSNSQRLAELARNGQAGPPDRPRRRELRDDWFQADRHGADHGRGQRPGGRMFRIASTTCERSSGPRSKSRRSARSTSASRCPANCACDAGEPLSAPTPQCLALDSRLTIRHLPRRKDWRIGCVGAGFIMRDCHLVAYRNAGFNPGRHRVAQSRHGREGRGAARHPTRPRHYRRPARRPAESKSSMSPCRRDAQPDLIRQAVELGNGRLRGILAQKPLALSRAARRRTCVERCARARASCWPSTRTCATTSRCGRRRTCSTAAGSASPCSRPSTCGRSRTGCRGPRGCRRCPRSS